MGAIGNLLASPGIAADYALWGYPAYFHYVTAAMEGATAVLLLFRRTRAPGAMLGGVAMASAAATLVWHADYLHALAPSVVLVACLAVAAISLSRG